MTRDKFALGIDYGTESGRAVVVRVANGEEVASAIVPYLDGVIDDKLPGGPRLEPDWALQNPRDYLLVLEKGVPKALKEAGVRPDDVVGIGTDFTACTPLPTLRDGTPLCFLSRYRKHPHAWVKLWKHHAAQPEANRINEVGRERNEEFIRVYGGKYSSEWFFSKVLQVLDEAPKEYAAADRFIEGADWIVWQLTGEEKYARWHQMAHDWAYAHFPDREHGEWYGYLHRDGSVSTPIKGNIWKGPFHLPRMQWYCWKLLEEIAGQ